MCHEVGSEESVWREERKSGSLLEDGVATSLGCNLSDGYCSIWEGWGGPST